MFKALAPQLIASGLAAAVGAGVGGVITYLVVTQDAQIKLQMSSYGSFLTDASQVLVLANERELNDEDLTPLRRALTILAFSASAEVLCWASVFSESVRSGAGDAPDDYDYLVATMRQEIMGDEMPGMASIGECSLPASHRR